VEDEFDLGEELDNEADKGDSSEEEDSDAEEE
jgi:hypothetical protein